MTQPHFSLDEFKSRRQALCNQIGSAHVLIVSAPAPDNSALFRQYNDFYYLCGVEVPQSYLLIDGATGHTTLFLPGDEDGSCESNEEFLSASRPEAAIAATGVDAVLDRHSMTEALQTVNELYTYHRDGEGRKASYRNIIDAQAQRDKDPWDGRPNRGAYFVERLRSEFPGMTVKDLDSIVYEMRMIKSPAELSLLRHAGKVSARALIDAMRATKPGVMEFELAAILQYHYVGGGAQDNAYSPIVAGGKNAFLPHYGTNDSVLCDGDLVLVDCAPDYKYYCSDITRMWPVNGTYTPAQRAIYGFLTEYHKTLLSAIRPGRTCDEIEDEAIERMSARLGEFNFASDIHAEGAQWTLRFHNHLAHSVGLSVHDGVSHKKGELKPGMVFAVDPQMRIKEESLYLRVEDTGLVTEDGFDVFTKDVPLELDAIEALVTGHGITQDYPPVPFQS